MYKLSHFGSVVLPTASSRHTAGTFNSKERIVRVLGGLYDASGSEKWESDLPFELAYFCKVLGSSATDLRTKLDQLRSLRGTENRLYRHPFNSFSRQWALARLQRIEYDTEVVHSHGVFQPLTLMWLVKSTWRGTLHGQTWYLNQGHLLDSGLYLNMHDRYALTTTPQTLTLTNGGNAAADDVTLTLEAGATPVTGVTFTMGACQLVWSGTVAANKQLVINCSPVVMSVLNDGVAAWSDLDLGGSHASPVWMRLASGTNSMVVTRTGGGSDTYLTVDVSDAWE